MKNELFAIFKNGYHKGNERGFSKNDAIIKYVKASLFEEYLTDSKFMSQYTSIKAKNGIHFNEILIKK